MILSIEVIPCSLIQRNVTFLGSYGLTILVHTNLCGSILHFIYQTLLNISLAISWILLGKLCI
jgi:hypothetical protein